MNWDKSFCEITATTVAWLDAISNSYIHKWLGLPWCLFDAALFGRNTLQLPLKSISLGYKLEKTRLELELRQSSEDFVWNAGVKVQTGRKWKADDCVDNLKHQEYVGRTQQGRQGLGWGEACNFWSKVSIKERKKLVITEVTRFEEERLHVKSVGQGKQGLWTKWATSCQGQSVGATFVEFPKTSSVSLLEPLMTHFLA